MSDDGPTLPSCTIVIEWENAIDVHDRWACEAVAGLERELRRTAPFVGDRPVVSYLFDAGAVDPQTIERVLAEAAPGLREAAEVRLVPTSGLTYYELKNHGAALSETEVVVFLDSDAAPQDGWLAAMLSPFREDGVTAVGGITVLAYEDFFSKALALSWIFGLREERTATAGEWGIYANNTAVRTAFIKAHPFPRLPAYKYSCVFWLRSLLAGGHRYVRVPEALTVHAPHPGYRFLAWRAWITGLDRDFYVFHARARSRTRRGSKAAGFFLARTARTWWRVLAKRRSVDLPLWQVPGAMGVALLYNGGVLAGQVWSTITRRHAELPAI